MVTVAAACEPPAPRADDSRLGQCRADPFVSGPVAALGPIASAHHLTASVFDDRTGCWYRFRPGERVTTASVVKVEIMAGTLLRAQNAGRNLTVGETALVTPMIHDSANAPASSLWSGLGGVTGMSRVGDAFGLAATNEVGPVWGLTSTTADDQAAFVEHLLQGPGPLDAGHRGLAWTFLRGVRPDQRWGVPAGVPDGWEVGNKNGFAGSTCCGWRVNSVGYVADPAGGGYAVAILSDRWPNQAAGVPTVETVARAVNAELGAAG